MDTLDTKRKKAADMRYKKPVAKGLNFDEIYQSLLDISEECDNVRWYFEEDDLIDALIGDEEESYEFRMMFCDLSAEAEQLLEDLKEVLWHEEIKETFNLWFPAVSNEPLLGWDTYESDYMPITGPFVKDDARDIARKKVLRMKKEDLLDTAELSFRIIRSYLGLSVRYDQLKASMDIIKDSNNAHLQVVKKITEVYEKANDSHFWGKEVRELEKLADAMPQEAWIW